LGLLFQSSLTRNRTLSTIRCRTQWKSQRSKRSLCNLEGTSQDVRCSILTAIRNSSCDSIQFISIMPNSRLNLPLGTEMMLSLWGGDSHFWCIEGNDEREQKIPVIPFSCRVPNLKLFKERGHDGLAKLHLLDDEHQDWPRGTAASRK
jgi:hypothetical protein